MAKLVMLTKTFEDENAERIDNRVNKWLIKLNRYDFYEFEIHTISKYYENGKHVVNIIFEMNSMWANKVIE